ncbi:MAG: sigma 54-interacting transcriptional regulator, partial [Pacificimonas sp.]
LDEITEMDVRLQAKLLRVLQERVIDRVGGNRPVPVDIRILATSNRDMAKAVRDGEFREDLMFRLNVVNLKLPPLRERPGDVKALAGHFAAKFADLNGVETKPVNDDALRALLSHDWPGNVRELENTMHRAVLLATDSAIEAEHIVLPDGSRPGAKTIMVEGADGVAVQQSAVGRTVAEVEQDLIIDTLKHTFGNRTHAANILGISIRTLRNKLNEYTRTGVPVPQPGLATEKAA